MQVLTVAEPEQRKCAMRHDKTAYKNAVRAVEMTERFPGQSLKEEDGLLLCVACKTYVSFKEGDVKQHCFGQQKKGQKLDVVSAARLVLALRSKQKTRKAAQSDLLGDS